MELENRDSLRRHKAENPPCLVFSLHPTYVQLYLASNSKWNNGPDVY